NNKVLPNIGEIHTGELYKKNLFHYKYAITAALLMFIFISSAYAHSYYTPITTIVISINPSVSLEANRWDKIINSKALNSDGSQILNNIKIKNKSIDDGLELIVKEAKIENFINDKYITDKKVINVNIESKEDRTIDVSNFKKVIDSNNLIFKISGPSNNNNKIKIIANNKKLNTNDLTPNNNNNNNNKRETPNKKSNNNSKSIKKPSVDINTNIIENKSSKSKNEIKKNTEPTNRKQNKTNKDIPLENNNSNNDKNSSTIKSSSTIENFDIPVKIENDLHDSENKNTENIEIPNGNGESKNHTDNNEMKKTDNALDEFVEDDDD
ncbi:MAG: hypothetical protein MUO60_20680, partial [Clostridiaceae bacterium]|nr:hypothetical protein [Clostridiaceae bacterium]